MTQGEIEGNELIRIFMGWELPEHRIGKIRFVAGKNLGLEYFGFHNNWNMLMPVVEKIEDMDEVDLVQIDGFCCTIYSADGQEILGDATTMSKIESVWKAVVEFIKWYNFQKLPEGKSN